MNLRNPVARKWSRFATNGRMQTMKWLSQWRARVSNCPFSVVAVETSTHCHRRCRYCPVSVSPKPRAFMSDAVFDTIVGQLAELGFDGRFTYHLYNEPLLNKNLERLVAKSATALPRAKHVIYTSGDQLTRDRADSLLQAGIDGFVVSNHGGRELTDWVARAARRSPIPFGRIRYRRIKPTNALFNRGGLVSVDNQRRHSFCAYPAYELIIDVKGDVLLCCNDYHGDNCFGNVMDNTMLDIWHSPRMMQIRRDLLEGRFSLPICRTCAGVPQSSILH